jgi:uncharacterized protein (TIGR01777 family)
MKLAITGGSGFIGQALTCYFLSKGHEIFLFTRKKTVKSSHKNVTYVSWDPSLFFIPDDLPPMDVVINLAGATINKRWTSTTKDEILTSRMESTQTVVNYIKTNPPELLINASAIGYYGTSLTNVFSEEDFVTPSDFLSKVTHAWEAEAMKATDYGVRVVPIRFGLVLGSEGGALPRLILPYRFFAGGRVGSGKQWVSWIHIEDLVRLIDFVITNESIDGPLNGTSPVPIHMEQLNQTLAQVLKKPNVIPLPALILKLALGEMSDLVLKGQKVLPTKALDFGFTFQHPEIQGALTDLT